MLAYSSAEERTTHVLRVREFRTGDFKVAILPTNTLCKVQEEMFAIFLEPKIKINKLLFHILVI